MNLALKDILYHRFKFFSAVAGVGLMLMLVLVIGGVVRGAIEDSAAIVVAVDADLWVVEKDRQGPFAENSRIPEDYYHAVEVIPGVAHASPLVIAWESVVRMPHMTPVMKGMYMNARFTTETMTEPGWMDMPKVQRFVLIGYKPGRMGGPSNLVAGRGIEADNYEIVADERAGFQVGERFRLKYHDYTVVGITRNMVGFTADPVLYTTLKETQSIVNKPDPDLLRDRRDRYGQQALLLDKAMAPLMVEPLAERADALAENNHFVSAIAVKLEPGASAEEVAGAIARWKVVTVYTAPQEVNIQVMGSNRLTIFQMSVLRILLVLIAGIVIGQLIYTFTLDKVKVIATLKLLGAKDTRIKGMVMQQAIFMGVLGMLVGAALERAIQPYFPRRVDATYGDIAITLVAVVVLSVLASLIAIRRAMKVDARSVLGV
jgi:putative ABC transport system permease protein